MISLMQLLKEVQGRPVAILLAGAPGAGKGSVLADLDLSGLKTLNLDDTIAALAKADGFTLNQKAADAEDRSKFMDDTIGMKKDDRQNYFDNFYK